MAADDSTARGPRSPRFSRATQVAVVAPAVVFLFVLPIAHTTPLRIACLVLAALAAAFAAFALPRRMSAGRPATSLVVAIAFWACVCLAACYHSIDPSYSWGEFRNEVVSTVAAFAIFWLLTDDASTARLWATALLASFVVVAIVATASYLFGGDWRRSGFVGDRNAYSTYVVLIAPFLIHRWFAAAGDRRRRIGLALALALALVSASLTQNLNVWLAVAIEAACFAALVWGRQSSAARRRLRARYLAAAVVGIALFAGALAFTVQQKAVVSGTSTEEQARFDRDPRFEIWRYAATRIAERPWLGHGYGRGILRGDFRTHFDNPLKWHGHNLFIDYVMEAGIAGGVAIVGLLAALAMQAWRIYRLDDPALWPLGAWALTMLAGILVKVMTDDILVRDNALLFWSMLGMAFGQASRRGRSDPLRLDT